MDDAIKAPTISFSGTGINFTFTPIESNFITEDTEETKQIKDPYLKKIKEKYNYMVIIYQLKMVKKSKETIVNIPYYISDGRTNRLRANLIFPFICFNEADKDGPRDVCPYSETWGLLYKYSFVKNLIFHKFPDRKYYYVRIDKDTVKYIDDKIRVFPGHTDEAGSFSHGLESVIPRLQNLHDFILALSFSERINNPEIKIESFSFRPIPSDHFQKFFNYNYNVQTINVQTIKTFKIREEGPDKGKQVNYEYDEDLQRKDILRYLTHFKKAIPKTLKIDRTTYSLIQKKTINLKKKFYF
jgi:hypothetical protein